QDVPFFAAALSAAAIALPNFSSHFTVFGVLPRTSFRRSPSMQKVRLRSAFSFAAWHFSSGIGAARAPPASTKHRAGVVVVRIIALSLLAAVSARARRVVGATMGVALPRLRRRVR